MAAPATRDPASPATTGAAVTEALVDVVIVSYRCRDLMLRALDSLLGDESAPALAITVVDNDSADGTVSAVRAAYPTVRVVALQRNTGFSYANNVGIRTGTSRYVLVLNPDTVVGPAALHRLVEFADAHPRAGVVAPALRNPDGSDQLTARAFPTPSAAIFGRRSPLTRLAPNNPWSTRFLAGRGHVGDEAFTVDWVSGAAMLVPRAVLDEVGGFDEDFFLFWEDADLCRRINNAGYEVWCLPAATVTHHEGGSRAHAWTAPTIRWFHQSIYRYWVKHHAPSPLNPARWLAAALLTVRAAVLIVRHAARPTVRPHPTNGPVTS